MDKLLKAISKDVTPESSELKNANLIVDHVMKNLGLKVVVGGSFAKGTVGRGIHDIDFFVLFDSEKEMALLKPSLKKLFSKIEELQGSRKVSAKTNGSSDSINWDSTRPPFFQS